MRAIRILAPIGLTSLLLLPSTAAAGREEPAFRSSPAATKLDSSRSFRPQTANENSTGPFSLTVPETGSTTCNQRCVA